ncbi:hypothetical protein R4Z10_10330 [Niallia sp. XMNu-256]|uniref:hypothetical protein n=1 Tax=Niallia sp. XMNu-256 TaxID=3082444 RepID=UPI0030CFA20F
MYLLRSLSEDVQSSQLAFNNETKTKRLILGALFAGISALLQAQGGFLPGIGYLISPFATLPILICAMFSKSLGVMSYILTIFLLFLLLPSELLVFPFTTGLLGVGIGAAFYFFKQRLSIISVGAILLTLGIMFLLYVVRFPVLGPVASDSFSFITAGSVCLFAFLYSWVWMELGLFFFKRLKPLII